MRADRRSLLTSHNDGVDDCGRELSLDATSSRPCDFKRSDARSATFRSVEDFLKVKTRLPLREFAASVFLLRASSNRPSEFRPDASQQYEYSGVTGQEGQYRSVVARTAALAVSDGVRGLMDLMKPPNSVPEVGGRGFV